MKNLKNIQKIETGKVASFSTLLKFKKTCTVDSSVSVIEEAIRDIVHNFYIIEKRRSSPRSIMAKVRVAEIEFKADLTSLSRLIHKMGFKWKKTSNDRKTFMESYDIPYKRTEYLKAMIVYL